MSQEIKLPIVIDGKRIYKANKYLEIHYDSGVSVTIPELSQEHISVLGAGNKYILHDLPLQEIVSFVVKIGRFWRDKSNKNPLYREAIENLCLINGYDETMAIREMNLIGSAWSNLSGLYDMVDYELGNRFYLDEWLPRGDALVHTQPMGNLVNIMVGNVPVSGVMSILRGILTKNRTIAKLPKRDPITTMYLIMSMCEVAPDHPVTKSMNVVYWKGGDSLEKEIVNIADVVCVWGGKDAVEGIKRISNVPCVIFGPKTSYSVVCKEAVNNKKSAMDLAHDISLYNQEACFCPQVAFVEGDYTVFVANLAKALRIYNNILPKGNIIFDTKANVTRSRLEAMYLGNDVICDESLEWTIIVINDLREINEHPLNRVIYIKQIESIAEITKYIDKSVQTISIAPWSRNSEIREKATLLGAAKLTEIGMVASMRNGATHDDIYPMQHFVRWVCVERGADYWGKFIENGPIDTTVWLMQNKEDLKDLSTYYCNE